MSPKFELNHLKYFYFTVLEGGVEKAARRLHVQQPVVSKMLGSLEDGFGQPLLKKSGRRKVMTDFGQLVFRHCQVLFHEIEKLGELSGEKNHSRTSRLWLCRSYSQRSACGNPKGFQR